MESQEKMIKFMQEKGARLARSDSGGYYTRYKGLTVFDLLKCLEDENLHTEETLVEALVSMDYNKIIEACRIIIEQDKAGCLTDELYKRRCAIDDEIRKS